MNLPDIFLSPASLRSAFEAGLDRQLKEDSLGTFILVLANAIFDKQVFLRLESRLRHKFESLNQKISRDLQTGKHINDAPDDVLVFLKLIAMGFDNLQTTEYRQTRNWELQFNQLRSLRPKRMSLDRAFTLYEAYNDNAFQFNKPFLQKEIFWSGYINNVEVRLLYNKFPFATLHGLLVPEPEKKLPQFLTAEMHNFVSTLCNNIGKKIPDIAIAYNAYGAGASINHLHFQIFSSETPLPVMNSHWQHNGGTEDYPATCKSFSDDKKSWQYIEGLHRINVTYDLLYLPGRIICLPRKYQGDFKQPGWTESFAWYELCGGITTFNKDDFLSLEDQTITEGLALLKAL